jgi:hypothetical protein
MNALAQVRRRVVELGGADQPRRTRPLALHQLLLLVMEPGLQIGVRLDA